MPAPVLIVGMSRSGTSVLTRLFELLPDATVINEAHLVWKSASFDRLDDEDADHVVDEQVGRIRRWMEQRGGGQTLVEKSPPNVLRPRLVHAVFPDARVVYVERDPVACVYSNLVRSLDGAGMHPRIIAGKYFRHRRRQKHVTTDYSHEVSSVIGPSLLSQLRPRDLPSFAVYAARLARLRAKALLPFGPRLRNFDALVAQHGFLRYHTEAMNRSIERRADFARLYGSSLLQVRFEDLVSSESALRELFDHCNLRQPSLPMEQLMMNFASFASQRSLIPSHIDRQVSALLLDGGTR